ncbi:MAG: hypothetical protein ACK559_16790, partial [bacterium]
ERDGHPASRARGKRVVVRRRRADCGCGDVHRRDQLDVHASRSRGRSTPAARGGGGLDRQPGGTQRRDRADDRYHGSDRAGDRRRGRQQPDQCRRARGGRDRTRQRGAR